MYVLLLLLFLLILLYIALINVSRHLDDDADAHSANTLGDSWPLSPQITPLPSSQTSSQATAAPPALPTLVQASVPAQASSAAVAPAARTVVPQSSARGAPRDQPPLQPRPAVKRHLVGIAITFCYALTARGFTPAHPLWSEIESSFRPLLSVRLDAKCLEVMWDSRSLPPFDHNATPIYCPGKSTTLFDSDALEESWILLGYQKLPDDMVKALFGFPRGPHVPPFVVEYDYLLERFCHERRCKGIIESDLIEYAMSKSRDGVLSAFYTKGYIARSAETYNPVAVRAEKCTKLTVRHGKRHLCDTCLKLRHSLRSSRNKALRAKAPEPSSSPSNSTPTPPAPATIEEAQLRKLDKLLQSSCRSPDLKWHCRVLRDAFAALVTERIAPETHLGQVLSQNLHDANLKDRRAVRYSKYLIAFYQCARFISGWRGSEFRRGTPNAGCGNRGGHLANDPAGLRNSEPARSTLQASTPPDVLCPTVAEGLQRLKDVLPQAPASARIGGISMDALHLSPGLSLVQCRMVLAGCSSTEMGGLGVIPVKNIKDFTVERLRADLGTQVEQFFYTSTNGKLSLPLGYVVQQSELGIPLAGVVCTLIQELQKLGVVVHWTSSDGFTGSADFIASLKKRLRDLQWPTEVHHVFDYQHLLKCINRALQASMQCITLPNGELLKFCASDLLDIRAAAIEVGDALHLALAELLQDNVVCPVDTMEWAPVKAVFRIAEHLRKVEAAGVVKHSSIGPLATYYEHMAAIYEAFSFKSDKSWQERLDLLAKAVEFFSKLGTGRGKGISVPTMKHLRVTHQSLSAMGTWLLRHGVDVRGLAWSHISTLVIENFFSRIRAKHRYPNLAEYAATFRGAFNLLVFTLAIDCVRGKAPPDMFGHVRFLFFFFFVVFSVALHHPLNIVSNLGVWQRRGNHLLT